jgi:hypothetical protein
MTDELKDIAEEANGLASDATNILEQLSDLVIDEDIDEDIQARAQAVLQFMEALNDAIRRWRKELRR